MTPWGMVGLAVLVLGVVVGVRLAWWRWDHIRDRGTTFNPIAGGHAVRIPTTRELRESRAYHPPTPTPAWRELDLVATAAPWHEPVAEGALVELHDANGNRYGARIVARAGRWTETIGVHCDYLGEVKSADDFRVVFTHDKIWTVLSFTPEKV